VVGLHQFSPAGGLCGQEGLGTPGAELPTGSIAMPIRRWRISGWRMASCTADDTDRQRPAACRPVKKPFYSATSKSLSPLSRTVGILLIPRVDALVR
jgi:hypothetical protein